MHRKSDTYELDIPKDDIECWERYPKHRWVYELSRLLDAQHIKWSPYEVESMPDRELNIVLESIESVMRQPGYIYLKRPEGVHTVTEVYITKGEVKMMRHIDPVTRLELPSLIGEIELRLNAFITLYFQKFTGVISTDTYANEILRIRLRPFVDLANEADVETLKLARRIYKRTDVIVNGPTDRILHESLTS